MAEPSNDPSVFQTSEESAETQKWWERLMVTHPGTPCEDDCATYMGDATDPWTRDGFKRVFRGGSWPLRPRHVRVAIREAGEPDGAFGPVGFRLVRTTMP